MSDAFTVNAAVVTPGCAVTLICGALLPVVTSISSFILCTPCPSFKSQLYSATTLYGTFDVKFSIVPLKLVKVLINVVPLYTFTFTKLPTLPKSVSTTSYVNDDDVDEANNSIVGVLNTGVSTTCSEAIVCSPIPSFKL